jgi:DNA-binding IclR family transcriptional regulator
MLQGVTKAVRMLSLFSTERPEWGVNEAARALGMPKSSTSELMTSLMNQHLLRRNHKGKYLLGWRLFELSQTLLDTTEYRAESRRVMEKLVACWKETVHLAVLEGARVVYIEKVKPTPAVEIPFSRVGARLPAHCSAVGKVLLASQDWGEIAELIERHGMPAFTPNTIITLEDLASELEQVREQGYAYDTEEASIGLCCVAAPIRGSSNEVVAAISLAVPAYRFYPGRPKYTAAIVEAARSASALTTARVYQHATEVRRNAS